MAGEGEWECIKEVLRWIIDIEVGTFALPERRLQELCDLLDIPTTQWCMGRKYLERSVGNLCSMHLAVQLAVAHLYHLQCELSHAGVDRAWLSPEFHYNISDWRKLIEQTAAQTTHL